MKDNGERRFLFQLHGILNRAERLTNNDGDEFIVLPSELVKDLQSRLLMVINRLPGKLTEDE